jgi:glycosyltransferase involved in cell wall biosynthesis
MGAPPALVIALPHGLEIGGVTTFAVRLANGLAAAGRPVAVVTHPERVRRGALEASWHAGVEVVRVEGRFEDSPGNLSRLVPLYRDVVRRMAGQSGGPVALAPQLLGDCYGTAASLCCLEPELTRIIGWQHSDIEYDARVLARYEPVLTRFVGVSSVIAGTLRERLAGRALDVVEIPYGVEVSPAMPRRPARDGPVRLVYVGRLDHQQKRILALVHLSRTLERQGVTHTLTIAGEGPAAEELGQYGRGSAGFRCIGGLTPERVSRLLLDSDALVLPSRYEGLSVSMLEAMAAGCVPILARTRSGAAQAVEPGYNGEIADVDPAADEREAGEAMAEAVQRFLGRDRAAMAEAAWRTVGERFSIQRHVRAVAAMIDSAALDPPRAWPADRACAFSTGDGASGSGSVPPDGATRLRSLLERLASRTIVIHGAGQHTIQLAPVLAASPAEIIAIADDDRARHGQRLLGWPIIAPAEASRHGATDVVISAWMHEAAIWERRAVYERQGLRVHRLYSAGVTIPA